MFNVSATDPSLYNFSNSSSVTSGTSVSFSHTFSGTDGYVVVCLHSRASGSNPTSLVATYGGTSMTLLQTSDNNVDQTAMFGLKNPSTGAQTVAISWSNSNSHLFGTAMSFQDVDQTTPVQEFQEVNSGSAQFLNVTLVNNNTNVIYGSCYTSAGGAGNSVNTNEVKIQGDTFTGFGFGTSIKYGNSTTNYIGWDNGAADLMTLIGITLEGTGVPVPTPIQGKNFTNITMNFNSHALMPGNLTDYWTNMNSSVNYMEFVVEDLDFQYDENISTRVATFPMSAGEKNSNALLMGSSLLNTSGIVINSSYQVPSFFEVTSYERNTTYKVTPYGCKKILNNDPTSSCSPANDFYIIIQDANTTQGEGFIASLSKGLASALPEKNTLTSTQKLGVAAAIIIITNIIIFLGGSGFFEGTVLLILSGIASVLEFIYFSANGYIPIGITLLAGLIVVAIFYLKGRN